MNEPKAGDSVEWNSSQGKVVGKVVRKVTGTAHVKSHVAKASPDKPEFEVRSDKTGRKAIHKADALKKHAKSR